MIVKDEAPVIRRCLESVRPMIDTWCIVDTGSTDTTQDIIRDFFADLPGDLHQRPWVDFAHNRSEALALARPMADYSLIMDADDTLAVPITPQGMTADAYTVGILNQGTTYRRIQMVKNTLPWRYRGVLHEFLECPEAGPAQDLPLVICCGDDSARSRDPETYRKDAMILQDAFDAEADPFLKARYGFYLAQSWRDCGEAENALTCYLWRADQQFWHEEVYISLLNAARLSERIAPPAVGLGLYQQAIDLVPTRAEAYHGKARLHRARNEFVHGFYIAQKAAELTAPPNGLFVEQWIYDWGVLDELSISAYWAGRYRVALDAGELLLAEAKCPDLDRIRTNANFARRKLIVAAS